MATPWGGGPFLEEDAQGFAKLVVRTHPGSGREDQGNDHTPNRASNAAGNNIMGK